MAGNSGGLYVTAVKRVGTPTDGLAPAREALVFDENVFEIVDQPKAVYTDPRGAEVHGASLVTARDRALVAVRVRWNETSLEYEIQRGYGVASVVQQGSGAARVTFTTPFPDALYAPFVTPVRGDTPGNVGNPYDVDAHTGYVDVFFLDETATPVSASFVLRIDLAS